MELAAAVVIAVLYFIIGLLVLCIMVSKAEANHCNLETLERLRASNLELAQELADIEARLEELVRGMSNEKGRPYPIGA